MDGVSSPVIQTEVSDSVSVPVISPTPSKLKIISVTILGIVGYPIFQFATISLVLIGSCRSGCGLEGIAIMVAAGIIGSFIYILLYLFLSKLILKHTKSVVISVATTTAFWMAFFIISNLLMINQSKLMLTDYLTSHNPARDKAIQTHLQITSFEENGTLDAQGFIDTLTIKLTVLSDQDVEVNNPFRYVIADQSFPGCRGVQRSKEAYLKTVQLQKGPNTVVETIGRNDLELFGDFPSSDVEVPIFVLPYFSAHVPASRFRTVEENNVGNGTDIQNVEDTTGLPKDTICNIEERGIAFSTKPYKIHVVYKPYPTIKHR